MVDGYIQNILIAGSKKREGLIDRERKKKKRVGHVGTCIHIYTYKGKKEKKKKRASLGHQILS